MNKYFILPVLGFISSCATESITRLHFSPDKQIEANAGRDLNGVDIFNSGRGLSLTGEPVGDKVQLRSDSDINFLTRAIIGDELPAAIGIPQQTEVDENGNPDNQLMCQTGRGLGKVLSTWTPIRDTRTANNGKVHTYFLSVGSGGSNSQTVRFRFGSYQESDIFSGSGALTIEWYRNRLYAYPIGQSLTEDRSQLRRLQNFPMLRGHHPIDAPFRTNPLTIQFDTGQQTCSIIVNGATETLDSRYCNATDEGGYKISIHASSTEAPISVNGRYNTTSFCIRSILIFSNVKN